MELILLRHGKAEDRHPKGDFFRELTPKGYSQSSSVALLLQASGRLPEVVLTSPFIRARQTADEFCRVGGFDAPLIEPWLACGMRPQDALSELAGYQSFGRVVIVGHEPDFSGLVEWLLGARGGTVEFKKAAIAGLLVTPPSRVGRLLFLVPSKFSLAREST